MNTDKVRLNITLPKDLVASLNEIAGPRQRNRFIEDTLIERMESLKKTQLEKKLVEGYKRTAKEGLEITKEFETTDIEGWDEY